jgi:hypothetical protein
MLRYGRVPRREHPLVLARTRSDSWCLILDSSETFRSPMSSRFGWVQRTFTGA